MNSSLIPAGLVLSPLLGALLVTAFAFNSPRLARFLTILNSAVSVGLAVAATRVCAGGAVLTYAYGGWPAPFGIAARIDGLAAVVATMIACVAVAVFVFAGHNLRSQMPRDEPAFYALGLLLIAALQGMTGAADLFNLYVFLEISSLAAYALVAVGGGRAALASFRYLLIGTVGASFYLLGVAYLFALTGSLNADDIASILGQLPRSPAMLTGLSLLTIGLGLKMAVFPMHGWLPDAYTYAPTATSALLGGLMTKVSALALLRIFYSVFAPGQPELLTPVTNLLGLLGCLGVVVGSFMALAQRDVKRLLAYSSVAHLGFIAIGLSLGNRAGLTGAVFHMLAHGVAKATLFLVAGGVADQLGGRRVSDLAGLHRRMPLTSAALVVAAFSMIGIPPTAGFFSKWYLLLGCLEAGRYGLFAVIIGSTLISAWYFLRLFEVIFFSKAEDPAPRHELPVSMAGPIAAGAVALLVLGLFNQVAIGSLIEASPTVAEMPGMVARVGGAGLVDTAVGR